MVNLRNMPPPRSFLSHPQQRRLLLLVFTLGIVVLGMFEARKAANWQWFTQLDNPQVEPAGASPVESDPVETVGAETDRAVSDPADPEATPFFPGFRLSTPNCSNCRLFT